VSEEKLEKIKKLNMPNYISKHYGIECKKGHIHCPFHPPDKRPSLSIWQNCDGIWLWKCHHDNSFTGTLIDFVAKYENISIKDAILKLKKEVSLEEKDKGTKLYIDRFHIYVDIDGKPVHKKIKYKNSSNEGKKWAFEHYTEEGWKPGKGNHELIPYNLDRFKDYKSVVICEGERDADTINALGLGLLATSAPTGKSSWSDSLTKYFEQIKKTTFVYDVGNEEDARKHATELKSTFPNMIVYIAKVPLEEKEADITDYLRQEGDKQMAFLDVQKHAEKFELEKEQVKKPGPILINLDSIEPISVEWLWHNRIPLGKLSLIVGDPGLGKSFLMISIASHVTTGKCWPDIGDPVPKGSVIILTAEDGLADTVRIRADAAGADVKKIKILEGIINKDGEEDFFNFLEHLPDLEQAIKKTEDIRLVCIDPITAYLGNVDSNKNSEVRRILAPLASLAEKYKIAIIGISHLNKNTVLRAIYRTMGSLGFVAAARAVWAICMDKNDESWNRRFFMPLKTNLSINPISLAFSIVENKVVFEENPVYVNVEDTLSEERSEETSELNRAISWLKEALEDGPVASKDIYKMAKENGISKATLRRGQEKLKVKPNKEGSAKDKKWYWKLPDD